MVLVSPFFQIFPNFDFFSKLISNLFWYFFHFFILKYFVGARELQELLNLDQRVRVFIIFIGSLGDQATRLTNEMPAGNVFVAMNTSDIPIIIKNCLSYLA